MAVYIHVFYDLINFHSKVDQSISFMLLMDFDMIENLLCLLMVYLLVEGNLFGVNLYGEVKDL